MASRLIVRITAPILAISGLLLAAGVVGAWYVQRMQRNVSENLLWNVRTMRAAEELEIALREVGRQLHLFRITNDRRHLREIARARPDVDHWFAEARRLAVVGRETDLMARATRGYGRLLAEFDRVRKQPDAAGLGGRLRRLEKILVNEVLPPVHEYLDLNEEEVEEIARENQDLAERLVLGLLLLGTCGAGAGLLAGYGIARGISRSLVQLSVPVRDAAGKLSEVVGPITLSAGGGLAELEGTLRKMAWQIGTVVERLQQSQREVLRAEQLAAVGQLAAGMAHEVRNPLMAMKVLVQSAALRPDDAGLTGRDLVVLEEEITRLERLTRTFLDFARPPQLEKRTFDLRGVLEQAVGLVSGRAGHQGVAVACRLPEAPAPVHADMGQVRQVVLNLLLNALDALPNGGTVTVTLSSTAPAGDGAGRGWLTVAVADCGAGLPPELGEHIFEPFVSTKETGLGLGLSICKRIVEAHGGAITAANRPEGGAEFNVRLPRSPGAWPAGVGASAPERGALAP
jgi:signal transduction histidine kinase